MIATPNHSEPKGLYRHSSDDRLFVLFLILHGCLILIQPAWLWIALAFWWSTNTVAHNFIHLPFFRSQSLNRLFSLLLTAVLGLPQTLWRDRHLAHHAGRSWKWKSSPEFGREILLAAGVHLLLWHWQESFYFWSYLPGLAAGLGLCWLQGFFEHRNEPVSCYGRWYNRLFFNDGFHWEHHRHPGRHWRRLSPLPGAATSPWPPILRWMDWFSLDSLERQVLRWPRVQSFLVRCHLRAMEKVAGHLPDHGRALIVGGGIFPRTVRVLRAWRPGWEIRVLEKNQEHLQSARRLAEERVEYQHGSYQEGDAVEADFLIIPLAFCGDKRALYDHPPARWTLVHDWIWRSRGKGAVVSWLLGKRINLISSNNS